MMGMLSKGSDSTTAAESAYRQYSKKKVVFLAASLVLLILLALLTLRLGKTGLSSSQIVRLLFRPDDSWNSTVIWKLRLPRIIAALAAGASLGIAGAVMQSILRNPLASPFTLGISNAAAFGAALAITVFNGGSMYGSTEAFLQVSHPLSLTVSAFFCAMLATLLVVLLVGFTNSRPETIVLAGLAINAIFGSGLAILTYLADDMAIASIVFWQYGSLSKAEWSNLHVLVIILVLAAAYFIVKRWDYNAIEAGEDTARGLGVNINATKLVSLSVSALLTATAVSFFGIIGFVGLIGPHIVKRLIGGDNRYVLLGSMLIGAIVLLSSHIVGSYAFGMVVPVGIITSAIGGPLFLGILLRGYKK